MKTVGHIQWYNDNEGRSYPLAEAATGATDTDVQLPMDIIADMGLLVPPSYGNVYLSSLYVSDTLVTLGIRSTSTGLLVGTYSRSAVVPYTAYALTAIADDVSGWAPAGVHGCSATPSG